MKICNKCKENKELIHFYVNDQYKGGYNARCKECMGKYRKQFYEKNPNYNENYYVKNAEFCKENASKYYENNKNKVKEYQLKNRDKIYKYERVHRKQDKFRAYNAEYGRIRRKDDIQFKLAHNLRTRVRTILKRNKKPGSAVKDLGCTVDDLKFWLEFWWEEGMSWQNYGINDGQWSIDHIIPLSKLNLTIREDFLKGCHYTNLQPLWHIDNIKKYNKIG